MSGATENETERSSAGLGASPAEVAQHERISALFLEAIDVDPGARESYLARACADDLELRKRVEALLTRDAGTALVDAPVLRSTVLGEFAASAARMDEPPVRIGDYEILGLLGQGGMATVYRAQQTAPKRMVALKVLNAGWLSAGLLRRFEIETEFLARLHHPGIAQIYEAGTADVGGVRTPFFAMELVDGLRLTEYCNRRNLDPSARLRLLLRVCDAVQHAHQRGVIHRDLKPGNILVADEVETGQQDGVGTAGAAHRTSGAENSRLPAAQAKVLDFGVARAIDTDVTQMTAKTHTGELIGTLPYMSPEQVSGPAHRIDTRSDIYALGVIAYELLSGRLPIDVRACPIPDAVRRICDDEPTRLSSLNRTARGDLETIVAKAMEKDKERRYATVAELAADIDRYLKHEPILARPASVLYNLGKFARRNRGLVYGTAATMLALVGGIVGTTYGLLRAREQRDEALQAREAERIAKVTAQQETALALSVNQFLNRMFESANPMGDAAQSHRDFTVREMLDVESQRLKEAFQDQPFVERELRVTIGKAYRVLGQFEQAELHLRRAMQLALQGATPRRDRVARIQRELGAVLVRKDQIDAGVEMLRASLATEREIGSPEGPDAVMAESQLAWALISQEKFDEAQPLLEHVIQVHERSDSREDRESLAGALNNLARLRRALDDNDAAEALYQRSLDLFAQLHGPDYAAIGTIENNLAVIAAVRGDYGLAEKRYRRAIQIMEHALGDEHPVLADTLNNLAGVLSDRMQYDSAIETSLRALQVYRNTVGQLHSDYLLCLANTATIQFEAHRFEDALRSIDELRARYRIVLGEDHWRTHYGDCMYANALVELGRYDAAESVLGPAFERLKALRPPPAAHTLVGVRVWVKLFERTGREDLAQAYRAMLPGESESQPGSAPASANAPASGSAPATAK